MDWQARDRESADKIWEIVIRSPEPLTRSKLLAELGIGNMLRRDPGSRGLLHAPSARAG